MRRDVRRSPTRAPLCAFPDVPRAAKRGESAGSDSEDDTYAEGIIKQLFTFGSRKGNEYSDVVFSQRVGFLERGERVPSVSYSTMSGIVRVTLPNLQRKDSPRVEFRVALVLGEPLEGRPDDFPDDEPEAEKLQSPCEPPPTFEDPFSYMRVQSTQMPDNALIALKYYNCDFYRDYGIAEADDVGSVVYDLVGAVARVVSEARGVRFFRILAVPEKIDLTRAPLCSGLWEYYTYGKQGGAPRFEGNDGERVFTIARFVAAGAERWGRGFFETATLSVEKSTVVFETAGSRTASPVTLQLRLTTGELLEESDPDPAEMKKLVDGIIASSPHPRTGVVEHEPTSVIVIGGKSKIPFNYEYASKKTMARVLFAKCTMRADFAGFKRNDKVDLIGYSIERGVFTACNAKKSYTFKLVYHYV